MSLFKATFFLNCGGFTDVRPNSTTKTVCPMSVPTNWHTVLIVGVTWFIGVPVYKSKDIVLWCPSERPFLKHVVPSDPVLTTVPPLRWTQSWQKKNNEQFVNTTIISLFHRYPKKKNDKNDIKSTFLVKPCKMWTNSRRKVFKHFKTGVSWNVECLET